MLSVLGTVNIEMIICGLIVLISMMDTKMEIFMRVQTKVCVREYKQQLDRPMYTEYVH